MICFQIINLIIVAGYLTVFIFIFVTKDETLNWIFGAMTIVSFAYVIGLYVWAIIREHIYEKQEKST